MEENYEYNIDDLKALEAEVIIAQNNYQVSAQEEDKLVYDQLLAKFELLLLKHIIFSTIKAYQFRSAKTADLSAELKAKRVAYFGDDLLYPKK